MKTEKLETLMRDSYFGFAVRAQNVRDH